MQRLFRADRSRREVEVVRVHHGEFAVVNGKEIIEPLLDDLPRLLLGARELTGNQIGPHRVSLSRGHDGGIYSGNPPQYEHQIVPTMSPSSPLKNSRESRCCRFWVSGKARSRRRAGPHVERAQHRLRPKIGATRRAQGTLGPLSTARLVNDGSASPPRRAAEIGPKLPHARPREFFNGLLAPIQANPKWF